MKLISIAMVATMFASTQAASIGLDLFHDGNCQDQFKAIKVQADTCATPSPGWSSMRVNKIEASVGGSITAYTRNNCGEPTAGSHGYSVVLGACLKNFGFTANAVGFGL